MSEKKRDRLFPWMCAECGKKEVRPQRTNYQAEIKHESHTYAIVVPDLLLPTCGSCGEQVFTAAADDQVAAALRDHLKLLSPEKIRAQRTQLELSQEELAEQLGAAKETISRWETGAMIQSRAMDNLLRLFFECAEAREFLRRLQDPAPEDTDSTPRNRVAFFFQKMTVATENVATFRLN